MHLVHVLALPPSYVRAGLDMAVTFPDDTVNPRIKEEVIVRVMPMNVSSRRDGPR